MITLSELHCNPAEAFKNDQLNSILNSPPHASWIKKHPLAKVKNDAGEQVPSEYIPIDKVEFLLLRIFQRIKVEVLSTTTMFNSVAVTVRLHYLNPIDNEWYFHDGVGACSVQTDAGKSAADLGAIKSAGVQIALPAAKSYALKDAAEHLGKLFGKDLNRRNTIDFVGGYSKPIETEVEKTEPAAQEPANQNITNNFTQFDNL